MFGRYDNILQVVYVRFEFDLDVLALLPLTQRVHLCLVTYHLEVNGRVAFRVADIEITIHVRCRAVTRVDGALAGRFDKVQLYKRQRLTRIRVDYYACNGGNLFLRTCRSKYDKQYEQYV